MVFAGCTETTANLKILSLFPTGGLDTAPAVGAGVHPSLPLRVTRPPNRLEGFQRLYQRVRILRSADTDADMVSQAGLVEITNEDSEFLCQP